MKCGHAANAVNMQTNQPSCAICAGLTPDADIVAQVQPDLKGRFAHCAYGRHAKVPSSTDLAFFEHRPRDEEDIYYCGCYGWD
jgi:hypothetical protein